MYELPEEKTAHVSGGDFWITVYQRDGSDSSSSSYDAMGNFAGYSEAAYADNIGACYAPISTAGSSMAMWGGLAAIGGIAIGMVPGLMGVGAAIAIGGAGTGAMGPAYDRARGAP